MMMRRGALLGMLLPMLLSGATSASSAMPAIEDMASDPLAFNSWCFNVLLNEGPRLGYADEATRQQAAFAMGESATRFLRLSEAAGMGRDAMVAYDQAMADHAAKRAAAADQAANGGRTGTERALFDACMANGIGGMRAKALHVDPNEGMHGRMWCADTLSIMTQRGLIEGGPEEVARAHQAISQSELLRTRLFGFLGVPESDRNALRMGYLYLALVQVEAFTLSGRQKPVRE